MVGIVLHGQIMYMSAYKQYPLPGRVEMVDRGSLLMTSVSTVMLNLTFTLSHRYCLCSVCQFERCLIRDEDKMRHKIYILP